eukprot:CAMPEP_0118963040 /NCGR_PEP_ID=MMETSP1173-20130426/1129_1 /TAXON_ID=1034831 /ORGANISM="Rhizochromulina marina cf, Strain CCMP1243" /LENGTH=263 /DNA_ID=CAMNT_0006911355 /DNA_START=98 /DNA_END=889 /DNA_ORIENTATION=-
MRGMGRVGDGNTPQEWFYSLPPITRSLLVAVLATTAACSFGIVSPFQLHLDWTRVWRGFEIWRLASNFVFFGTFSFPFLINLYLLVQYASRYEVSPFNTGAGGSSADFAWMLTIGCSLLAIASYFFGLPFMGQPMSFMIMYVWTRKNPDEMTSIFFFKFQAFYLPWAMLAFNLLIGNDIYLPLMGIAAGHVYYFLHYTAPAELGRDIIKTPTFMIELLGGTPTTPGSFRPRTAPTAPRAAAGGAAARPYAGHNWGSGNVLGAD